MLNRRWTLVAMDGSLAAVLIAAWWWHAFRVIFQRPEWYDWVAYALPAGNWVERGWLATPQLGPQFHFDRAWLFNSPLMGAGPAPLYWLFGTGRVSYLVGVSAFAVANLAAFAWVIRRALTLRSVALSLFCALAVVGDRIYLASYSNQRYDLIAYAAMLLAFAPMATGSARGAGLVLGLRGSLPLLHPALVPASVLWLAVEVVAGLSRRRTTADATGRVRPAGPILFATAWVLAACWYGRAEGLESQFLPHLRFHSVRTAEGSQAGRVFEAVSALPFSIPTLATTFLIASTAFGLVFAALTRFRGRIPVRVLIPAVLIAGVVAVDLLRGFAYWGFYLLGLGPCLLFAFGEFPRPRRIALAVLIVLAAAHSAVALRLDRRVTARLAGQREAVAFLVAQTRPGETIAVGPPFIMASAPRSLPGGRRVVRVLPQPFYLLEFDRDRFRADIESQTTTYIGGPEWFTRVTIGGGLGRESAPLFEGAEIGEARFFGEPVIVARRVRDTAPRDSKRGTAVRPPAAEKSPAGRMPH